MKRLLRDDFSKKGEDYKPHYIMFIFLDSIWLQEVYIHHKKNAEDVYNWATFNLTVQDRFEELMF